MRKGVKLAGLLAVGVAAFAVACSPMCNPVPVADPHGTPEQQWNWWRETYATADYGQADLAGYTSLSDIPQCGMEDGSTAGGYERICEWRAVSVGNRMGESYVLVDDRLDDEAVERVEDEENSLICVGRFRFDSLLAEGLAEWFKCDRYDGLVKHVRSCWLSRGGDDWYFYFVTGCGYDVISSDLLGCDADGVARRKFVDFLNGEEVAR